MTLIVTTNLFFKTFKNFFKGLVFVILIDSEFHIKGPL